jgi:hypothetical protein
MGVWNAYRRLADQYARAWSAGIGCVSDKWADAIDYSGFVLPVAAVNVRSAVSSVPGGTRLVAAADDAYSAITPPLISAVEANYAAAERILAAQRGWVVAYLKMYSPDPAGHVGQNG